MASRCTRRALLSTLAAGALAAGTAFWRGRARSRERTAAASLRLESARRPAQIAAVPGRAELVPFDGLADLLADLIPCWYSFKVTRALHALRLWGTAADFGRRGLPIPFDSPVYSGADLRSMLFDNRAFARRISGESPLLNRTLEGVLPRQGVGRISLGNADGYAHADDLLCTCAELGLPLDERLYVDERPAVVGDLLRCSLARFDSGQELEWTIEAYARYLAPRRSWMNRFGERHTFDAVVSQLTRVQPGTGACLGTHVP